MNHMILLSQLIIEDMLNIIFANAFMIINFVN